jgi:hypothetical protein
MQSNRSFVNSSDYYLTYDTLDEYNLQAGYNYLPLGENIFVYEGSVLLLSEDSTGRVAVVNSSATEVSDFFYNRNAASQVLTNLHANFSYKFLIQVEYIDGRKMRQLT